MLMCAPFQNHQGAQRILAQILNLSFEHQHLFFFLIKTVFWISERHLCMFLFLSPLVQIYAAIKL